MKLSLPQGRPLKNSMIGMLNCPKVHLRRVCGASGCAFKTVPINIQAAEVLTSDASSENVRSIDVLTFLSHHNMVKKRQSNTSVSPNKQNATKTKQQTTKEAKGKIATKTSTKMRAHNAHTHTQTETLRYTETKQQRLRCGLRSPWSVIKFWGSKPDLVKKLHFRECCGVVSKVADNTSSCSSVRSF